MSKTVKMRGKGKRYIPARELAVTMTVRGPVGVGNRELRGYIHKALQTWGGSFDPFEDDLFDGVNTSGIKIRDTSAGEPGYVTAFFDGMQKAADELRTTADELQCREEPIHPHHAANRIRLIAARIAKPVSGAVRL